MVRINLSDSEKSAIRQIDTRTLDRLIDEAVMAEFLGPLYGLPLSSCGGDVSLKLNSFDRALQDLRKAKSAKNRADKSSWARRAGDDLSFAVSGMKSRLETEEREGQFFHVDDDMLWPHRLSESMQIRVPYRWRAAADDSWNLGSITFHHSVRPDPLSRLSTTARKPSKAKLEQERQDNLARTYEYLRMLAVSSVRDYLKDGGDGAQIPDTFKIREDSRGGLNNYSADFWRVHP